MSINPNSHRPLNIDQEITRLNLEFQEFDTIDRKKISNKCKQYSLIATFVIIALASMHFVIVPTLEEKKIRNATSNDPIKDTFFLIFGIMLAGLAPFVALLSSKISNSFYKDPLIVKYVKNDQQNDHIYLNLTNERKLNRIEYNDLSNLKMVSNSETGKTLPDDVWKIISGYINTK